MVIAADIMLVCRGNIRDLLRERRSRWQLELGLQVCFDLLLQVAHPPRAQDGEQQARLARRDQQRQPGGGERKILKLGAA